MIKIIGLGFWRKNVKVSDFPHLESLVSFGFVKFLQVFFEHLVKVIEFGLWRKSKFPHLESLVSIGFVKSLQMFYFLILNENYSFGVLKKKCQSVWFFPLRKFSEFCFCKSLQVFYYLTLSENYWVWVLKKKV